MSPAARTVDRGTTITFTADEADGVTWDTDEDGEFDDGEGSQATRRFVRSGTFVVRARSDGGARTGSATVVVRYPGGPLAPQSDVTSIQQDASHTGYRSTPDPAPPLARRWSVSFGGNPGAPLIADGQVFVLTSGAVPALHALDPATGVHLWERPLGDAGDHAILAYEAGRVMVETSNDLFQVFDGATGTPIATRADGAESGVVARNGLVFPSGGDIRAFSGLDLGTAWTGDRSTEARAVSALDRADVFHPGSPCTQGTSFDQVLGERQWSAVAPGNNCGQGRWAAVYDGLVFTSATTDQGVVREARDGARLRDFRSWRMPAFAPGLVVLADRDGSVRAEGLRDGTQRWRVALTATRPPLVVHDRVYLTTATDVVALSLDTGSVLWRDTLPSVDEAFGSALSGLAAADGMLLVPGQGTLTAYESLGGGRPAAREPVPPGTLAPEPAPLLPADAPAPRGDPARTAHSATPIGTSAPTPLWQTGSIGVVGEPIVASGAVFVVTSSGLQPLTLRAYNALTGLPMWQKTGPAIGREVVFDGTSVFVHNGVRTFGSPDVERVAAYNALTGVELWTRTFETDASADNLVASDGVVYVARNSRLTALDARTGATRWDVSSAGNGGYPLALADGTLVRTQPCGAEARRTTDGSLAWSYAACGGGGGGDVAVSEGRVYSSESGGSGGLVHDLQSGRIIASLRSYAQQAFGRGVAIQVLGDRVQALDAASGRLRWRTPPLAENRFSSQYDGVLAPVVTGGQVVFGFGTKLHAFSLDTGTSLWTTTLPSSAPMREPFGRAPSLNVGGGLLVVPLADQLVAYRVGPAVTPLPLPLPELPPVQLP